MQDFEIKAASISVFQYMTKGFKIIPSRRYYCIDGNKTAQTSDKTCRLDENCDEFDEADNFGLAEIVKFTFKPFHLALICKRDKIVDLMLQKALEEEDHETRLANLEMLIGSRTRLQELSPEPQIMKTYDKVMDSITSFLILLIRLFAKKMMIFFQVDLMLDGMTSIHVAAR